MRRESLHEHPAAEIALLTVSVGLVPIIALKAGSKLRNWQPARAAACSTATELLRRCVELKGA